MIFDISQCTLWKLRRARMSRGTCHGALQQFSLHAVSNVINDLQTSLNTLFESSLTISDINSTAAYFTTKQVHTCLNGIMRHQWRRLRYSSSSSSSSSVLALYSFQQRFFYDFIYHTQSLSPCNSYTLDALNQNQQQKVFKGCKPLQCWKLT